MIRWLFQSSRYSSGLMRRYSEAWSIYRARSDSFRSTRSRSTTGISSREQSMLEDPKIEELTEPKRLEAVTTKRVAVENHPAGAKDAAEQGRGRRIEDDHVNLVGSEMRRDSADDVESCLDRVCTVGDVYCDIHVAQRREVAYRGAAEHIREDRRWAG